MNALFVRYNGNEITEMQQAFMILVGEETQGLR